ncbi:MAG: GerMN domain-containing protein [Desulfitobacterium sp.]|nr:GerMN domain-containing protein [Desulfitobacterium sp.]
MKKLSIILSLIFVLTLVGCTGKEPTPQDEPTPNQQQGEQTTQGASLEDYLDYQANTKYYYEGHGNEYASFTKYVDYKSDGKVQLRTNNGGTETVRVLGIENGQLIQMLGQGETYYRENLTNSPKLDYNGEVILKEPLQEGTTWTLPDNRTRTITGVDVEVTTPAGTYKAIEITTEGEYSKIRDYYAPKVGLVKSLFVGEDDYEVSSVLSKLEKETPLTQSVTIYYPNIDDDKLRTTNVEFSFKTNDITKDILAKELKKEAGDRGRLIGENVKIQSLYLNQDGRVYVDFSKELVTEMNAGSGYEAMLLQSIVNTLGDYYGVSEVYLTIDNQPYSSGHIEMKKGEFFKVTRD